MEKNIRVDPKGCAMLSRAEMQQIKGGSLTETIIKLVMSATEYFYRMGIMEAKRMKATM